MASVSDSRSPSKSQDSNNKKRKREKQEANQATKPKRQRSKGKLDQEAADKTSGTNETPEEQPSNELMVSGGDKLAELGGSNFALSRGRQGENADNTLEAYSGWRISKAIGGRIANIDPIMTPDNR
jgi:hypothetical protein